MKLASIFFKASANIFEKLWSANKKKECKSALPSVCGIINYLITPSSLPTFVKAAIALSRSSRL